MSQVIRNIDGLLEHIMLNCQPDERGELKITMARIRAIIPQFVETEEDEHEDKFGWLDMQGALKNILALTGHDGLFRFVDGNNDCGCGMSDLIPCDDGPYPDCVPAYRIVVDGITVYVPKKEE